MNDLPEDVRYDRQWMAIHDLRNTGFINKAEADVMIARARGIRDVARKLRAERPNITRDEVLEAT